MQQSTEIINEFRSKAELVSAAVHEVGDVSGAFDLVVDICHRKEACALIPSGCESDLSDKARELCDSKGPKIIAAPNLTRQQLEMLDGRCVDKGIQTVSQGMRAYLGGIDIGLTWARFGIADTGTLVVESTDEDLRLATMVSEIHVALLPKSRIFASATDIADRLRSNMTDNGNFTAMITGPSRTADIERVLALGVHGPLELHIMLIEEDHA